LLFSDEQYIEAATAYIRGIERRLRADLDPRVASVASLFISRWDVAVQNQVAPEMRNRLGIAIAKSTYEAYRELLATPRWQTLAHAGAMPQRLLWASTGTKDPAAPDTLYIQALAAADTINTMPAATLEAFADHGLVQETVPPDGGDYRATLAAFSHAGTNETELSERLQIEGTASFSKSWNELLACIERKSATLKEMRWSQGRRQ
jgi:transaldolase